MCFLTRTPCIIPTPAPSSLRYGYVEYVLIILHIFQDKQRYNIIASLSLYKCSCSCSCSCYPALARWAPSQEVQAQATSYTERAYRTSHMLNMPGPVAKHNPSPSPSTVTVPPRRSDSDVTSPRCRCDLDAPVLTQDFIFCPRGRMSTSARCSGGRSEQFSH